MFTYATVYERRLNIQLHRFLFIRENCGKGMCGRCPSPQYYVSGKTGISITAEFAYTCVDCAVSSYELVVGYMVLYTVTVRM